MNRPDLNKDDIESIVESHDIATESVTTLAPSLTRQLSGVVLNGLSWHGRRFTVSVGQRVTRVMLQSGSPLRLDRPARRVSKAPW